MAGRRAGAADHFGLIRVELCENYDGVPEKLNDWFVPESLASAEVLDGEGVVASDFRIDHSGHVRLAFFVGLKWGSRRIGRVVQRLCEIETYKTVAMLGLMESRRLGPRLAQIDGALTGLMDNMTAEGGKAEQTLNAYLAWPPNWK